MGLNELTVNNPFVLGKYLSDKYFCERVEETEFLRKQIMNGRDVALISPRRIGKSGLIQHFFNHQDIKEILMQQISVKQPMKHVRQT